MTQNSSKKNRETPPKSAQSEALFEVLFNTLPDQIYYMDCEGRLLGANPACCAHHKKTLEEMVGKTVLDLYPGETAFHLYEEEQKIIRAGEVWREREKHIWADGTITWLETVKCPLRDEKNEIIGLAGMSRDITHQVVREEKLAQAREELGDAQNKMMPLPMDHPEARFQVGLRQINQAGGDFYDVISIGDGMTDYVVADVCGHDISASLWTASFKSLLGEFARAENKPLDICLMLNKALLRILPENAYFTVMYARVNRRDQALSLVNAGHPPGVIVDMQKRKVESVETDGDLLGMFDDAVFGLHEQSIHPGDRLYLFTDGLVEQTGNRDEGVQRFVEVCKKTLGETLDDSVFLGMASVCVKEQVDDDVVLLGIEV